MTSTFAVGNAYGDFAVQPFEMTGVASEAGRQLSSLRKVYKKACPVCGTEFEGIARRIYDKPACQVKAYRMRKKGLTVGHREDN